MLLGKLRSRPMTALSSWVGAGTRGGERTSFTWMSSTAADVSFDLQSPSRDESVASADCCCSRRPDILFA